ncbi:hypothetical protein KQI52_16435 [bacterium]|nr:hypothetical protein [bacterium]
MTDQPQTVESEATLELKSGQVAESPDVITALAGKMVSTTLRRHRESNRRGIIDPTFERTHFINPRFQENALLLALAGTHGVAVPDGMRPSELLTVAVRVVDVWLREQERNGAVHSTLEGGSDPMATAWGLYAISRTLALISNQIPTIMRSRALKGLKRAARYLQRAHSLPGPETRPLRAAAVKAAAEYLESGSLHTVAEHVKRDGDRLLHEQLQRTLLPNDAGAYAIALAYLTLSTPDPSAEDLDLWRTIIERCRMSTTPTGIMGGGAEVSIACLPLLTGFGLAAKHIPEADVQVKLLERAWASHWYDGLLDTESPWLVPMGYLMLEYRIQRPYKQPEPGLLAFERERLLAENGSGIWRVGDWLMRLGAGGSLGWMHHLPTESTRVFGSPVGSALREGPWILEGTRMRHPALTGRFQVLEEEALTVEGELLSTSIPGVQSMPRTTGFAMFRRRYTRDVIRLTPPQQLHSMRLNNPLPYRREIELKDGALTIETSVPGRVTHRLPMIWIGGPYGEMWIGKSKARVGNMLQERRVRELAFKGGLWPDWVVRFDRPVDILYEPVNVALASSPMRYLSAACGTVDIMTDDRLHMAWRVG